MLEPKNCGQCGVEYRPTRHWQKFCSSLCRDKSHITSFGNARRREDEAEDEFKARVRGYGRKALKTYSNNHVKNGMCRACTAPTAGTQISWCEKHWVAQAAWRAGCRGKGAVDYLKKLLETQNFTCPYTGKKLEIGTNASIDHIKPKSRFPELSKCLENLQWVDEHVNRAKRSLTHEEFLDLCEVIAEKSKWGKVENLGIGFCG